MAQKQRSALGCTVWMASRYESVSTVIDEPRAAAEHNKCTALPSLGESNAGRSS